MLSLKKQQHWWVFLAWTEESFCSSYSPHADSAQQLSFLFFSFPTAFLNTTSRLLFSSSLLKLCFVMIVHKNIGTYSQLVVTVCRNVLSVRIWLCSFSCFCFFFFLISFTIKSFDTAKVMERHHIVNGNQAFQYEMVCINLLCRVYPELNSAIIYNRVTAQIGQH